MLDCLGGTASTVQREPERLEPWDHAAIGVLLELELGFPAFLLILRFRPLLAPLTAFSIRRGAPGIALGIEPGLSLESCLTVRLLLLPAFLAFGVGLGLT